MAGTDLLTFSSITRAIRHRLAVVVATVLLALALGGAWVLLAPPVYQAESSLYVDPGSVNGLQQSDGLLSPYYVREATSWRVMQRVIASLAMTDVTPDQLARHVNAQALRGTNVLVIDAQPPTSPTRSLTRSSSRTGPTPRTGRTRPASTWRES